MWFAEIVWMDASSYLELNYDYTSFSPCEFIPYGIRSAVNNLINTNNARVLGISLHKLGYDDIAIQLNK